MTTKVTDLLQGVRNCPPDTIPVSCSNCTVMGRKNAHVRNSLKPRCAEPNFMGRAVLKGVNDVGFVHGDMRMIMHFPSAPPLHCVCGRKDFKIVVSQEDRFHFPIICFKCECGREKSIIVFAKNVDLTEPWVSEEIAEEECAPRSDIKSVYGSAVTCSCKRHYFSVLYEQRGFSFNPSEGPTMKLRCRVCGKWKKIILRGGIDVTLPWLSEEMREREREVVVRHDPNLCPDSRRFGEEEVVFVVVLEEG